MVYSDFEKLKYYLKQNKINLLSSNYSENVIVTIEVTKEKLEEIEKRKNELNFSILNINILKSKYI